MEHTLILVALIMGCSIMTIIIMIGLVFLFGFIGYVAGNNRTKRKFLKEQLEKGKGY